MDGVESGVTTLLMAYVSSLQLVISASADVLLSILDRFVI